jgi:hypothetical protein
LLSPGPRPVELHEGTFHAVRVDQHASSTDALFAAEAARAA